MCSPSEAEKSCSSTRATVAAETAVAMTAPPPELHLDQELEIALQ